MSVVDGLFDTAAAVDDDSQLVVISFFFSQAEEVAVMTVLSQSLSLPRVATYSHFQMVQFLPLVILGRMQISCNCQQPYQVEDLSFEQEGEEVQQPILTGFLLDHILALGVGEVQDSPLLEGALVVAD